MSGVGHHIAHPQPGDRPRFREAAEHDEAGVGRHLGDDGMLLPHHVDKGLIDHDEPPPVVKAQQVVRPPQHAGGVGGVADDHKVRIVAYRREHVEGFGQDHPVHGPAGVGENNVGFGEPRVDNSRVGDGQVGQ